MPDDGVLLEQWVKAKDAEAFTELVRRHAGLVYGTCRRIIRDHHTAEDVAQECLLEFASKAESIRSSVAGFLYSMAAMRARDRLRNDSVRGRHEIAAGAERQASASAAAEPTWEELTPFIDGALAELPDEQRLPLILHFLEGRSQAQVAEELGCDQATVSRRITRGVASLRERLGRLGITASVVLLSGVLAANAVEAAPPAVITAAGKMAVAGIGGTAATAAPLALGAQAVATATIIPLKAAAAIIAAAVLAAGSTIGFLLVSQRKDPAAAETPSPAPAQPSLAPTLGASDHHARWANGIPGDPNFFPIGVWLQSPADAPTYRQAGVNLYVGLWNGPTERDLSTLSAVGMKTICDQNDVGLRHLDDRTIVGWMGHLDPDNVQSDDRGNAPPVPMSEVISGYRTLTSKDASRPVCLLLGHGVAWDGFPGRGARRDHPEDYEEYVQGGDILGFRIYPVNNAEPAIHDNLWYVPRGVDHLHAWSNRAKPVWCWIECTKIGADSPVKPTPEQVRSEIWMALIHGADGIVYFCHTLKSGGGDSAALMRDPVMFPAVSALNRQIASLAPVLHGPTVPGGAAVSSSDPDVPVDALVKRHGGEIYVFAAAMRSGETTATFTMPAGTVPAGAQVEVLGEDRSLAMSAGIFSDRFQPYAVHLYRISSR